MSSQFDRPISRARAASCALVNLAATPGLGSLMARRVVAGTGQLLLALVGFVLIIGWMFELFRPIFLQEPEGSVSSNASGWMWRWGSICFGASWLWSLFTSLSFLRQAKAGEPAGPKPVPPRLTDVPGQPPKLS